jgi:hypothetical protein
MDSAIQLTGKEERFLASPVGYEPLIKAFSDVTLTFSRLCLETPKAWRPMEGV